MEDAASDPLATFDAKHNVRAAFNVLVRLRQMVRGEGGVHRPETMRPYDGDEVDMLLRNYEPVLSTIAMMAFGAGIDHARNCRPPRTETPKEGYA